MNKQINSYIKSVYLRYTTRYGFPQGLCKQIAEELQAHLGGEVVFGYLVFSAHERGHWWLELDNEIIDPMSDYLMETDPHRHEKYDERYSEDTPGGYMLMQLNKIWEDKNQ